MPDFESILAENFSFHTLTPPLARIGLNRLHLTDVKPFTINDSVFITNEVIIELDKFRNLERLSPAFVRKWTRILCGALCDSQINSMHKTLQCDGCQVLKEAVEVTNCEIEVLKRDKTTLNPEIEAKTDVINVQKAKFTLQAESVMEAELKKPIGIHIAGGHSVRGRCGKSHSVDAHSCTCIIIICQDHRILCSLKKTSFSLSSQTRTANAQDLKY
ncbi:hypothetical protein RRG08_001683 [Elysia crispata]|uniref:Uncharacterized protein n=1 Tax=Elysia crispata TaxID=231223 RepID=A0AAE1AKG6_9GAST|nr:hypothetical protein RRG08_001683 [Elysia crispata]